MRKTYFYLLFCVIGSCVVGNFNYDKKFEGDDDRLVKNKCYSCHAPNDYLHGPALTDIYKKEKSNYLKKYLEQQFYYKVNTAIYHEKIRLNKKQVSSIYVALKYYAPPSRK